MLNRSRLLPFVVLLASCAMRAPDPAAGNQLEPRYLYVAQQQTAAVSIIDTETNRLVERIDLTSLGFTANAKPHHTAVEPDGSHWYVSLIGDGKVLKFTRANELVGSVDFQAPGLLAIHPGEDLLYVGRSMAAVNPPQRIGRIDRSAMSIEEVDVFFPRPHAIAVNPGTGQIYAASLAVNQIAEIDGASESLELTTVDGGTHVFVQFAISPDGRTMVASGQISGRMLVFDISAPPAIRLIESIEVDAAPWHPAFTPDGRHVYVGNQNANTVTVIETEGWTVDAVIRGEGISQPHGIAVSPDGRWVYVSNHNLDGTYAPRAAGEQPGTVVVIDTRTRRIERVIEVDPYAAGVSVAAGR